MKQLTSAFKDLLTVLAVISTPFLIMFIITIHMDLGIWRGVTRHIDEFTYDYTSTTGMFSTFILYDQDSSEICHIHMNNNTKESTVFSNNKCIASSLNIIESKRVYNLLYGQIPQEDFKGYMTEKDTRRYFKSKTK